MNMNNLSKSPGIYTITDTNTGKFYIGSSVSMVKRWNQHVYRFNRGDHPNKQMQNIWNSDRTRLVFSETKIMLNATTKELLSEEQKLLDLACVGINRMCMNVLNVAGSHYGRKRSQETIAKLRSASKGKKHSEETRKKMSDAKIGRKLSDEHKKKLLENRKTSIKRPTGIINVRIRKLSNNDVVEIRAKRTSGYSWRKLSKEYEINVSAIRRAALGISYKDVL